MHSPHRHLESLPPPLDQPRGWWAIACALIVAALVGTGPARSTVRAEEASGKDLGTDRDAFTPSTKTIRPGSTLSEGSYVFIDNRAGLPTNNIPEFLLRVGGTDWLEWRLGVNYSVNAQGNVVTSVEVGEGRFDGQTLYEANMLYGFKADVTDQDGLLPESCFIMEAGTPTNGDLWGTVPVATIVAGWELPGEWRLDTSLRYIYAEWETGWFSRWAPTAILRMPVTERWEIHAEWFETVTQGLPIDSVRPFFSPGTHYLLTDDIEVGIRIGWGLNDVAAGFFSDTGIAWRY
jgi:hypothetical protein